LLLTSIFGASTANPGLLGAVSGDFLQEVLEFTMPGVLLMIVDKNWGDVHVDIHKDTIEYIQLTNVTISNTAFDGFGSKVDLVAPSDINLDIKGLNSTVNFLFEAKLWLGHIKANLTIDITDANLAVGAALWNDEGAL